MQGLDFKSSLIQLIESRLGSLLQGIPSHQQVMIWLTVATPPSWDHTCDTSDERDLEMTAMLSKQTIPNAGLEAAIKDESVQPSPQDGQGSSALYKDVDIYQVLVADLVIHHKEILQNIPLEIAIQTMKSAWKLSHSADEGFKG